MGLLADFQALNTDAVQLATDNGTVVMLTSQLATAQAAVAADNQASSDATQAVIADLQAAPYNGYSYVTDATTGGIKLLQVVPGDPTVTPSTLATLAVIPLTPAS